MKYCYAFPLLACCMLTTAISAAESSAQPADPTQQYRNKKAHEAVIHDAYYEAERYDKELPASWKNAIEKFGFKEDEIHFYTAVRTNTFVERIGNNIIILRPNFLLYATDAEQAAYIGLKLASLQAGEEFDFGGSHETFYRPKKSSFPLITGGVTALGLLALYRHQAIGQVQAAWPFVKNIVFSKGAGLVAGCLAANGTKKLLEERERIKKLTATQYVVIDKLGPDGILSIREKQAHWTSRHRSWLKHPLNTLRSQWYYLLGRLSLKYSPEADLERIKAYIAQKQK